MMNKAALSNNLVLLVTHLARETLPHIKLPIRVDGIEASGFDQRLERPLLTGSQSSTTELQLSTTHCIQAFKASSAKSSVRLKSPRYGVFVSDSNVAVQTPLSFPWMTSSDESDLSRSLLPENVPIKNPNSASSRSSHFHLGL